MIKFEPEKYCACIKGLRKIFDVFWAQQYALISRLSSFYSLPYIERLKAKMNFFI